MKVVIKDKIYIAKADIEAKHIFKIEGKFTLGNPKFFGLQKAGFPTKGVQKMYRLYEQVEGFYTFPIGGLEKLLSFLKFYDYEPVVIDKREAGKTIDFTFEFDTVDKAMLDYQDDIRDAMHGAPHGNGLIQAPPGSGKTITCLKYLSEIKTNTLIILHEFRIMEQWVEEIEKYGKGDFTLATFSGDGHNFGDITIALIQSGHKYMDYFDEFKKFGCVIIDECHHVGADTYVKLLNNLPAKHKFGFSATLKRIDKMDFLLTYFIGEKLIDVPENKVSDRITTFEVKFIKTQVPFELPYRETYNRGSKKQNLDFVTLCNQLTGFSGKSVDDFDTYDLGSKAMRRNEVILEQIENDIKLGHKCLILTNRRNHAKYLSHVLTKNGYKGLILISETRGEADISALRKSLDGIDFIIATEQIASEALDITDLSSIHLLIPSVNQYKLKQMIGRIRRVGKESKLLPVVNDYVDTEDSAYERDFFESRAARRNRFYSEWKSEFAYAV